MILLYKSIFSFFLFSKNWLFDRLIHVLVTNIVIIYVYFCVVDYLSWNLFLILILVNSCC